MSSSMSVVTEWEQQRWRVPNELLRVDKPQNLPVPKAIQTAKQQARQARRLVREGLAEPEPDKDVAGESVADVAQKDKLLVLDVEGQAEEGEDVHVLTVRKGQQKGYVYAGIVTQVSKKKVFLKLLSAPAGTGNSLSQNRLVIRRKEHVRQWASPQGRRIVRGTPNRRA